MSWSLISYNAPFIIAAAYVGMLLYLFGRRGRHIWLLGFLATSTIWQLLRFFFRPSSELAFIPDKAFLASTIMLGLTTALQVLIWLTAALTLMSLAAYLRTWLMHMSGYESGEAG